MGEEERPWGAAGDVGHLLAHDPVKADLLVLSATHPEAKAVMGDLVGDRPALEGQALQLPGTLFDLGEGVVADAESGLPESTEIEFDVLTETLYLEGSNGDPNLYFVEFAGNDEGSIMHLEGALNGLEFVG